MGVHVTISVTVQHGKNSNVAVFLDAINVINVRLCMKGLLNKLYLFVPLSVTMTMFQGCSSIKQL